jgi:hypothetical protein
MRIRPTLLLILGFATPLVARAQAPAAAALPKPAQLPADSMAVARKYTLWIYSALSDSLIAHMDSAGKAEPGQANAIASDAADLASRAGTETKVLEEKFITRNGNRQYWRTATFSNFGEPLLVRIVMGPKGEYKGRGFGPASHAPPIDP